MNNNLKIAGVSALAIVSVAVVGFFYIKSVENKAIS